MNFTYETQGAITYLVCELEPAEQVDSLTLGMLTNNHITGLAPVLYTEMNGQRFLKYNISAKVSADQFFSGTMNRERALLAFHNILSAICSADEYMIDPACFSVDPEHVFLNVSSCETAMLCIPVATGKDINTEAAAFFKKLLFDTQFDSSEDAAYITQLIGYVNNGTTFSVYGLLDLVNQLQAAPATPAARPQPAAQPAVKAAVPPQPAAPVSSFDSTISIDDMPAMMAQKQQAQPPVPPVPTPQPPVPPVPTPPPARPVIPQPPVVPQPTVPQPVVPPAGRPMDGGVPIPGNRVPQGNVKPAVAPKPPAQPGPGFAIPGQNGPGFAIPGQAGAAAKPQTPPAAPKKQPKAEAATGDKKMSLFGLLSNYNKENAELYKKQKAEAKAKKAEGAAAKPAAIPGKPGMAPGIPGAAPVPTNPVAAQPPFTPPVYQPPVQPVPVQNSFNETTVLSPSMLSGETTVLSAAPAVADPCFTRVKTGEKIHINKPVFRIGKEKSYVDYFIADNTAISRSHANVHTENGEYFIEDTNSTNHTYVNGKLINSNVKTKIVSGDKIRLANEDFTFSV